MRLKVALAQTKVYVGDAKGNLENFEIFCRCIQQLDSSSIRGVNVTSIGKRSTFSALIGGSCKREDNYNSAVLIEPRGNVYNIIHLPNRKIRKRFFFEHMNCKLGGAN
ncbi:MAG: hypothetical protein KIH01_06805 [Candidatus Freyarchaeota archaeon]|nr:hypothetical protein [Candidatus Jordarchaeia archaeon]